MIQLNAMFAVSAGMFTHKMLELQNKIVLNGGNKCSLDNGRDPILLIQFTLQMCSGVPFVPSRYFLFILSLYGVTIFKPVTAHMTYKRFHKGSFKCHLNRLLGNLCSSRP